MKTYQSNWEVYCAFHAVVMLKPPTITKGTRTTIKILRELANWDGVRDIHAWSTFDKNLIMKLYTDHFNGRVVGTR